MPVIMRSPARVGLTTQRFLHRPVRPVVVRAKYKSLRRSSTAARSRSSVATLALRVPFASLVDLGWQENQRLRSSFATLDLVDTDNTPDSGSLAHLIATKWLEVVSGPDLDDNHQPISRSWNTTEHAGTWGHYRILVGGKNVTRFRGAKTVVAQESDTEPFGDDTLQLIFPMIGPYEKLGTGDLDWLPSDDGDSVPVVIKRIDKNDNVHVRWEGDIDVDQDTYDGTTGQLGVTATGFFKTLDNRITKPRFTNDPIDVGKYIHDLVRYEAKYGWNGHPPEIVDTDVFTAERGGYGDPLCSMTLQNLLAIAQRGGSTNYTIKSVRPRTGKVIVKDMTTVHVSIECGLAGVTYSLTRDRRKGINTIFGEGQDNNTNFWRNTQYPNAPISPPAYPYDPAPSLSCGTNLFCPGSGLTGFQEFSDEARVRGYHLQSQDTYLAVDEEKITDLQDAMGVQIDGEVGPQTWNSMFKISFDAYALKAYVKPLTVKPAAEPFLYNGRGGIIDDNPSYTGYTRREKLEQYGPLSKSDAQESARAERPVISKPDYAGTITLTNIDFPEMSALDVRAGMNLLFKNHRGVDRLFHIAKADRNPGFTGDRVVTFMLSERGDDYVTLAARLQQKKDVVDQSGRTKAPRRTSKQTPDFAPWDSESGAGFFKNHAQTAGLWNVYPIPAGERGPVVHVRLVASVPTLIAAAVFNSPVTPDDLINMPGLADPSSGAAGGQDPWQVNAPRLTKLLTYADQPWLAWATGGPGAMQGYWPNTPAVGATVTGVLDDAMPWSFHSARGVWLFLAIWTQFSCLIGGDPDYDHRALFPGPEA